MLRLLAKLLRSSGDEESPAGVAASPKPPTASWQERVAAIQVSEAERQTVVVPSRQPRDKSASFDQLVRKRLQASGIHDFSDDDVKFIIATRKRPAREVWKDPRFIQMSAAWVRGKPKDAWFEIVRPCLSVMSSHLDLEQARKARIEIVKFRFGEMACGHCSYSLAMDSQKVMITEAPPLPHTECCHPDQCGCRWQAWTSILDEI